MTTLVPIDYLNATQQRVEASVVVKPGKRATLVLTPRFKQDWFSATHIAAWDVRHGLHLVGSEGEERARVTVSSVTVGTLEQIASHAFGRSDARWLAEFERTMDARGHWCAHPCSFSVFSRTSIGMPMLVHLYNPNLVASHVTIWLWGQGYELVQPWSRAVCPG